MRRVLPLGCLVFVVYGCAAGGSSTTAGFGDDGSAGDGGVFGDASTGMDGGGGDAAMDAGPLKTCVHTDDCTAPNICSGNNGVACMGGFCVPTGKPMNCDDGVACTNDSCDANTNKCKHTPNDSSCPNNSYCDPVSNCVQTLPCMTAGDTVCDRLNTTACDGLWSCDTMRKYCVHAPKPCQDRANATTMCTPMGQMAACSWACTMGYVDLNGDLQAMGTSNGCECHVTDATDKPTLANVDGNCDGIVGNKAQAIFVDTVSGNDSNPGTMAMPKKTIQAGIAAASAANPVKDVYVSKGTYGESVSLVNGVSIYGGYDAANGWSRAMGNATIISPQSNHAGVTASGLASATEVQLFTVTVPDANGTTSNGDGQSAYGIVIVGSNGGVTVRGCTISVGRGAQGGAGSNGQTGPGGSRGGDAIGSGPGSQGQPGGSSCGAPGGIGGAGVNGTVGGNSGNPGTRAAGGGAEGAGGAPGGSGSCNTTSSSPGGTAPPNTAVPQNGPAGANGTAGAVFGSFDSQGNYIGAAGLAGLGGAAGGGGGGGGSGGGSAGGTNFICSDCSAIASGGGGGGGGGGCGGSPGQGGHGGGGSFAIVAISSVVTIDATKMTTSGGGTGGAGGNGGGGGGGGGAGNGAGSVTSGSCGHQHSGAGANGVAGAAGGTGGGGAGGSGGPSACVIYKGTSPTQSNDQCTLGGGGLGGPGGSNGVNQPVTGATGQSLDTINSP